MNSASEFPNFYVTLLVPSYPLLSVSVSEGSYKEGVLLGDGNIPVALVKQSILDRDSHRFVLFLLSNLQKKAAGLKYAPQYNLHRVSDSVSHYAFSNS